MKVECCILFKLFWLVILSLLPAKIANASLEIIA